MNYTNPNEPNYKDKPEDWLNSALIFTKALGKILRINEGVLIHLEGDMIETLPEEWKGTTKVIVYKSDNNMVNVIKPKEEDLPEGIVDGQLIILDDGIE